MTDQNQARRAGIAAFFGTTVEWYDFFIYGTASALVLDSLFFPSLDPTAGKLAAFASFGAGYLARPLGAVVFGHVGDRVGRKKTLIITLMLMGIATVGIGLLPGYESAGILAPILLVTLRLVQGLAVGGEWGGAVLIASEHATKKSRVASGAWAQQGAPAGNLLAALAFLIVGQLPDAQFESWGWRIPFLASAVLIIIGLIIRSRIEEPKEFLEALKENRKRQPPVMEAFRTVPVLIIVGACVGTISASFGTYYKVLGLDYATSEVGIGRQAFLTALLVMSIFQFIFQPLCVIAARKWEPIQVIKVVLAITFPLIPVSWMAISTGEVWLATLGMIISLAPVCWLFGLLGGFLAESFPVHIRYTAISVSYQLNTLIFVATVPLVGAWLLSITGSVWSLIGMQLVYALITLVSSLYLSRRTGAGTRQPADTRAPEPQTAN